MTGNFNAEARIQRNRAAKARRFVGHFFNQIRATGIACPDLDKEALEKTLALVRDATEAQWKQLAKNMEENDPPSGATVELIKAELQRYIDTVDERKAALGKCRCGKDRDDPTDQMCRACQVNELVEGNREEAAALGERARF